MTFGEFVTFISFEMNKGGSLDSAIAPRVKLAGKRLEQNYTFSHMKSAFDLTLAVGSESVAAPDRMKSLEWIRYTLTSVDPNDPNNPNINIPEFRYLRQVDAMQFLFLEQTFPSGYWIEGTSTLHFDAMPQDTAVPLTALVNQYSDWDNATDNSDFWLLDNGEAAMIGTVMKLLAPVAREPNWLKLYDEMQTQGERDLMISDLSLRQANRDEVMIYANRGSFS